MARSRKLRGIRLSFNSSKGIWEVTLPKRLADRARLNEEISYPVNWEEAGHRKWLLSVPNDEEVDGNGGD